MKRLAAACLLLLLFAPAVAGAKPFTDFGGRTVELPDRVTHVWPAGPPSEALIYILAPEKLVGWTHRISPDSPPT